MRSGHFACTAQINLNVVALSQNFDESRGGAAVTSSEQHALGGC